MPCFIYRSIESGNHPTEASVQKAQEASEADGGARALQDAIDALTNTGPDYSSVGVGVVESQEVYHRPQQQNHGAALGKIDQDAGGDAASAAPESTVGGNAALAGNHQGRDGKRQEQGGQDKYGGEGSGQEDEDEEGDEEEYSEDNYDDEFDADEEEDEDEGETEEAEYQLVDTNGVTATSSEAPVEEGTKLSKGRGQESGVAGRGGVLQESSGGTGNGKIKDSASNPATASFESTREEGKDDTCASATVSGEEGRASGADGIDDVPAYLSGGIEVGEQDVSRGVFFLFCSTPIRAHSQCLIQPKINSTVFGAAVLSPEAFPPCQVASSTYVMSKKGPDHHPAPPKGYPTRNPTPS